MTNERILDTMDEVAYRELQTENKELKKRAQEAEGELIIIKGIGNTSPEMKALKERVVELDKSLPVVSKIIKGRGNPKWGGARLESKLIEKYADQWCRDNGYPIQKRKFVYNRYVK